MWGGLGQKISGPCCYSEFSEGLNASTAPAAPSAEPRNSPGRGRGVLAGLEVRVFVGLACFEFSFCCFESKCPREAGDGGIAPGRALPSRAQLPEGSASVGEVLLAHSPLGGRCPFQSLEKPKFSRERGSDGS